MSIIETNFFIEDKNSKINDFLSWRTFRSDKEFIEFLEDYLFWNIISKWDLQEYVSNEDIMTLIDSKIWK